MKIRVSLTAQTLDLIDSQNGNECLLARYPVSTARLGAGETVDSNRTPRGLHYIRARIGVGAPENAVFRGRRPTGEIWTPQLHAREPGRDWILTRILWLCGREIGKNRLGCVDTMRRYIYIHGTPEVDSIGRPGSHGCIRMRSADLIELFERVPLYTDVEIVE